MTNSNGTVAKENSPSIKVYKPSTKNTGSFGICIYGRGGSGKTTLLGTMPGKGLIIDVPQIEGGTFVLEDKSDKIDITSVEEWNGIDEVYWYLKSGKHDYAWVAIDSITAFQELAKRKVIRERPLDADPHAIGLQDWGKIGQLLSELVYRFRTLPLHTIWVAQERKHGNDDDGNSAIGPAVTPSALASLMPSMLMVGRLFVQQGSDGEWERRLRVQSHPDYYAKIRVKPGLVMPSVIAKPDLNVILRYLFAGGPAPAAAEEPSIIVLG